MTHPDQSVSLLQAIVLGLAQGLTEFIPVSSSAHLDILHRLFGQSRELTFDVLLHIGTLLALAIYFGKDWVQLFTDPAQRRLRNLVLAACIPAVPAGLLLHGLEKSNPWFTDLRAHACMLIIWGLFLWVADHLGRKRRNLDQANWKDAVVIGTFQVFALVPGVSRSGATITAGLMRRLTREAAARFSFLMSLPVVAGAAVLEISGLFRHHGTAAMDATPLVMVTGIVVSLLSGLWAIGFLLNYLKNHSVAIFVIWRLAVGVLLLWGVAGR